MPKLVATKSLRLSGGRVYAAGDPFEVRTEKEARVLKAIGKAADYAEPTEPRDPERDVLRQQARAMGIEVDGRWGADRLREAIAATGRYSRRDMVAEERTMPEAEPDTKAK